VIIKRKLRICI